jgi:hypothetical protein
MSVEWVGGSWVIPRLDEQTTRLPRGTHSTQSKGDDGQHLSGLWGTPGLIRRAAGQLVACRAPAFHREPLEWVTASAELEEIPGGSATESSDRRLLGGMDASRRGSSRPPLREH